MPFNRFADNRDASHRPLWGTYDDHRLSSSQHHTPVESSSVDRPASLPRVNQDVWTWTSPTVDLGLPSQAPYLRSDDRSSRQHHTNSQSSSDIEEGNVLDDPRLYSRHLHPETALASSSPFSAGFRLSSLLNLPLPEPDETTTQSHLPRSGRLSLYGDDDEEASHPPGQPRIDLAPANATQPSAMRPALRPFAIARPILSNASAIEPEFSTASNSSRPSSASATIKRNFDAITVSPPSTISSASREMLQSTDDRGEGSSSSATRTPRAALAPSANITGRGRTVHKRHRTAATDDLENISADDAVGSNGLVAESSHRNDGQLLARTISFPPALGVNLTEGPQERNGFADSILGSPPFLQSESSGIDEDESMTPLLSDDTEAPLWQDSTPRPVRESSPPRPTMGWSSTVSTEPSTAEGRSSPRQRNVSTAARAITNAFGPRPSQAFASSAAPTRPAVTSTAPSEGPTLGGDLSAAASSWLILANDFKLRLEQLTYDVQSATDQFTQWRAANPSRTADGNDVSPGRAPSARTGTREWQELQGRLREVQTLLEGGSQRIALASRLLPEGQGSSSDRGTNSGDGDASHSVDTVTPATSIDNRPAIGHQPAEVAIGSDLPALNLSLSEDGLLGETLSTAVERAGRTAASSTFDVRTDVSPMRGTESSSNFRHLRPLADLEWPRSSVRASPSSPQAEDRDASRVSIPRLPLVRSGSPLSFSFSHREDEPSRSSSTHRRPFVAAGSAPNDGTRTPRRLRASGNLREFRMARINNGPGSTPTTEAAEGSSPGSARGLPPPVHGTRHSYHTTSEDPHGPTHVVVTPRDSHPRHRPSISTMRRRWQPPTLPPRTSSASHDEDFEHTSEGLLAELLLPASSTTRRTQDDDSSNTRINYSSRGLAMAEYVRSGRRPPSRNDGRDDDVARRTALLRSRYDEIAMARAEEVQGLVSGRRRYGPPDWSALLRESSSSGDSSQPGTASEATSSNVTVSVRPQRESSREGATSEVQSTATTTTIPTEYTRALPRWEPIEPDWDLGLEQPFQAARFAVPALGVETMPIPRYRRGCPQAVINDLNVFVYSAACDSIHRNEQGSMPTRDRKGKGKAREDEEMEVERAISLTGGMQQESSGSSSPGSSSDTQSREETTSKLPRRPLDLACSICLDEYEPDSRLAETSWCGHSFHEDCLKQWLNQSRGCPLCRQEPGNSTPDRFRIAGGEESWSGTRRYHVNSRHDGHPWPPRRRDRLATVATAEAVAAGDRDFGNSSAVSLLSELG